MPASLAWMKPLGFDQFARCLSSYRNLISRPTEAP